jgi:hypothetical protein
VKKRRTQEKIEDESAGMDVLSETHALNLVLEELVARNDPDGKRTRTGHGLREVWAGVVGESVAAQTHSVFLRTGGELVVGVTTSVWAAELSLFVTEYQRRLNLALGEEAIHSIRFRVSKRLHE